VVAPDQESRRRVAGALAAEGIQTSVHYPSIPGFTAFRRFDGSDTPRSTAFATRVLTLPLFPGLQEEQVDEIAQVIRRTAVDAAVR
jgi:dTDP-4-amino-4,6-dideoxygalactose transaminase